VKPCQRIDPRSSVNGFDGDENLHLRCNLNHGASVVPPRSTTFVCAVFFARIRRESPTSTIVFRDTATAVTASPFVEATASKKLRPSKKLDTMPGDLD
jgi:hypothetical protein